MAFTHLPFSQLTALQLYHIIQLRIEVFVLEQKCPYNDTDNKDIEALHVYMYNTNNILVAHCRVLPPNISYKGYSSIGRVVVKKDFRKYGYGKHLMQYAIALCKNEYPNYAIKISAQLYLKKFYENLGFAIYTDVYLEDEIEHVGMVYKL